MKGRKTCSFCHATNGAAAKTCVECNHPFGIRAVPIKETAMPTEQTEVAKDSQVIVQQCFPPLYHYLGSHCFQKVSLNGPGIVIHVGVSPSGVQFQRNTIGELVSAAWNHCLKKTSLEKKS